MKKVLLVLGIATTMFSCNKEKFCSSNCGTIVSDSVYDYSVVIRNNCSGNEKVFYLSEGDWMDAHPGSDYCITNTTNW